jgi:type II secretory pathway component GspD/PulD (secretin)
VTGATFVGDLKDLTMRQAIEAVLFARGLDYDVQGTLIRVFPRKTSTRLFNVNYPNTRRSLTREVAGSSSSTTHTDFFDDLEKGVQSLLSTSGRMHVDRTAGIVQVTDYADRLDQVGVYVEAVQLRAGRQVRIDAQVFEVALPEGGASSIDWRTPAIRSATGVRSTATTASAPVATTDIGALIKAIAQQGVVTPMASPQVLAMNNEPAIVRFGDDPASADSSGRRGQGLTLTVVAQISADGIVQMHVSPSYSSRTGASLSAAIRVNQADTVVRVLDGETVVLSGFLTESAAAVDHATPSTRSELVILLTPTIVRSAASPH